MVIATARWSQTDQLTSLQFGTLCAHQRIESQASAKER